jgi:DnaJ like chaperone protein
MPLPLVLGGLGLLVGGIRGLILGVLIGFVINWVLRGNVAPGLSSAQEQFIESTFAVMGALSKADGRVTREEIETAEAMFDRLRLSAEMREKAKAAFNRGKGPDFDLDGEVHRFSAACRGQRMLLVLFLQIQCAAVASDGNVHPAEHAMLVRVARLLGLSEADVAQLEAMLRTGARGGPTGGDPRSTLADAYAVLGVPATATDAEVKRAYRRLMSQNHPDKFSGKGIPESMRAIAEERSREINTAYETIKIARGFT